MDKPFTDPKPLANTFGSAAIAAGLGGVFIPTSTSAVLTAAFPGALATVWFVGLLVCGIAALWGTHVSKIEGPALVGFGLGVGSCFLFSYGILLITTAGLPALTAASFILATAVTCLLRANHIRVRARKIRTTLRAQGG